MSRGDQSTLYPRPSIIKTNLFTLFSIGLLHQLLRDVFVKTEKRETKYAKTKNTRNIMRFFFHPIILAYCLFKQKIFHGIILYGAGGVLILICAHTKPCKLLRARLDATEKPFFYAKTRQNWFFRGVASFGCHCGAAPKPVFTQKTGFTKNYSDLVFHAKTGFRGNRIYVVSKPVFAKTGFKIPCHPNVVNP